MKSFRMGVSPEIESMQGVLLDLGYRVSMKV